MKTRFLFSLLTACLVALAAWLVHVPNSAQADEVPEKYRETVAKGLEYLAKNQFADGHWEGDGGQHPVAMTGLAGLALLMEAGPRRGPEPKHWANVRKAADWLIGKSQTGRDGLIYSGHPSETGRYMYGHGLATLFLAGVYRIESDDERRAQLKGVLNRAAKYIVNSQSTQGGWYQTSRAEGHDFDDLMATVIQVQALQAARSARIPYPGDVFNDALEYMRTTMAKYEQGATTGQNRGRPTETAAALACQACQLEKSLKYSKIEIPVGRDIQFGRDELTHYYYAQAMFNFHDAGTNVCADWISYRAAMFDHLQSTQNKDGSWPATLASQGASEGGLGVGPVYAAAVWCTVLQLDLRGHPSTIWFRPTK